MSWEMRKILQDIEEGRIPPDHSVPVEAGYLNNLVTEGLRARCTLRRIDSIVNNAASEKEAYRNLRDVLDEYFDQETLK